MRFVLKSFLVGLLYVSIFLSVIGGGIWAWGHAPVLMTTAGAIGFLTIVGMVIRSGGAWDAD